MDRPKQTIVIGAMGTLCERCTRKEKCEWQPTPPRCAVQCSEFENVGGVWKISDTDPKQTEIRE